MSDAAKKAYPAWDDEHIPMVKAMLLRGDRQSDIAACFSINAGRVAEIHNSMTTEFSIAENSLTKRARNIVPYNGELPPAGPYPSPYELWRLKRGAWALRATISGLQDLLDVMLRAVNKMDERIP
jgi:hypothetical protein